MLSRIFMRGLSAYGRNNEYSTRNLAPRPLTEEEMRPIAPGLSALLEEAVSLGTFPNGAETSAELAEKGLVKRLPVVQLEE